MIHAFSVLRAAAMVAACAFALCGCDEGTPLAPPPPPTPRVLIIGDSISIGYTPYVASELSTRGVEVVHNPGNANSTMYTLKYIDQWLGDTHWDVIHCNWGLHDIKVTDGAYTVPADAYRANLEALVARLKQTGATIVWTSSTPVPAQTVNVGRNNDDVLRYNAIAAEVMRAHGIRTHDLYTTALPLRDVEQVPNSVHFTEYGYQVLAQQVAAEIRAALQAPASHASGTTGP